jgi:hypothetical protein
MDILVRKTKFASRPWWQKSPSIPKELIHSPFHCRFASLLGKILSQIAINGRSLYDISGFTMKRPAITDPNFKNCVTPGRLYNEEPKIKSKLWWTSPHASMRAQLVRNMAVSPPFFAVNANTGSCVWGCGILMRVIHRVPDKFTTRHVHDKKSQPVDQLQNLSAPHDLFTTRSRLVHDRFLLKTSSFVFLSVDHLQRHVITSRLVHDWTCRERVANES